MEVVWVWGTLKSPLKGTWQLKELTQTRTDYPENEHGLFQLSKSPTFCGVFRPLRLRTAEMLPARAQSKPLVVTSVRGGPRGSFAQTSSGFVLLFLLFIVVVGKHFYIFAYCGLVGNPHLTANILKFLLPFQRQPVLLRSFPVDISYPSILDPGEEAAGAGQTADDAGDGQTCSGAIPSAGRAARRAASAAQAEAEDCEGEGMLN